MKTITDCITELRKIRDTIVYGTSQSIRLTQVILALEKNIAEQKADSPPAKTLDGQDSDVTRRGETIPPNH